MSLEDNFAAVSKIIFAALGDEGIPWRADDAARELVRRYKRAEAANAELRAALTELLRLYDWRNELGRAVKEGRATEQDQRADLHRYGREKKAAWDVARAALARAQEGMFAGKAEATYQALKDD